VLVPFDASKNATASALSENSWSNSNPSLYEKTPDDLVDQRRRELSDST
jgi:hypothetical protein